MNKSVWLLSALGVALVAIIIALILTFGGEKKDDGTLIGVIMPGSVTELGWNGTHYKGISEAVKELGARTLLIENIHENTGTCAGAIDSLIRAGAKMIILGSYNYPEEVADIISRHPDVLFICCSSLSDKPNYKVYFARVYQARYLAGIVAGKVTRNNRIGYMAAMNNNEVNRGINAFTLGVRKANPKATVFVTWTNSWDDEQKETENVDKLVDSLSIDLVTYHQNQDWVIKEAEKRGIMSIGYNLNESTYSPSMLTSVTTNWKMVYKEIIQDFIQQKQSISNYWVGIEKDAVGLPFYSSLVSDSVKALVDEASMKMKNGMDIFTGPIVDNTGKKRCDKDETVSDEELRGNMVWFVNGVELYEK